MSRIIARKVAMQLIYAHIVGNGLSDESIALAYEHHNCSPNEDDNKYIDNVVNGVKNNLNNLDSIISKHLISWDINKIDKINLAILRLSVYEMIYYSDIPNNVSISEAINMAKEFSDPKNARFLNGILGSISRDSVVTSIKK